MDKIQKDTGLSPEQVKRIKAARDRHIAIDPGCKELSPEEFVSWHPVGGISMEDRTQAMWASGIVPPEDLPTVAGK
jgi:hypothetical protein